MPKKAPYSVIDGKLIFRKIGSKKEKPVITEDELKDFNLQRLIIRRSRPQIRFFGPYRKRQFF